MGGTEIPPIAGAATVRARFTIPFLVAGQYAIDIGFYDRTGIALDEIQGSTTCEILKDNYLDMIENHGHHMGSIMVRSEWSCVEDRSANPTELIFIKGQTENQI
jgi:hypothetical protein